MFFLIFRWDISTIDVFPINMKHIYLALLDVYTEAKEEIAKEGRSDCIDYAIEEARYF